jgi:hypothetical protein
VHLFEDGNFIPDLCTRFKRHCTTAEVNTYKVLPVFDAVLADDLACIMSARRDVYGLDQGGFSTAEGLACAILDSISAGEQLDDG